jgi:ABC-type phosphate transport system permease subunit
MFRWMIATIVALFLFSGAMPFLKKFGIGRLPGDLNFTFFGKPVLIPLTSTIVLSLLAMAIAKLL